MAKTNNNVQSVLFLRNGSLYTNGRTEARQAIVANQGLVGDGEFILARYLDGNSHVQTLVGVKYHGTEGDYLTIIDMEGASADVEKLREEINAKLGNGITSANTATAQLAALSGGTFTPGTSSSADTSVEGAKAYAYDLIGTLDYTDTAATGSYVSKVDQADGVISVTREELPSVTAISEAGKPIIAVAEDKGQIAASAGTIDAQYVDVTGFTATTVQGALEELDDKIDNVVDGLDYTDTAVTGSYVSKVDEVNGVISVTREELPSSADTAVAKKVVIAVAEDKGQITVSRGELSSSAQTLVLTDNADGGVNFEVNIDNETIVQDETNKKLKVASAALTQYVGDGKTIEISAADEHNNKTVSTLLTLSSVTPSSEIVKEEYALKNASGETIGSTIKIYKDSHIVSIEFQDDPEKAHYQNLIYTYIDASGETQVEYVDISELVLEAEFASGITVTNHVAHGVVDPTSETFLTVGADGFKLSGVQDAIDGAVSGLDASVSAETTHISVKIDEVDGKLTAVTLNEDDIASADDLAQEILDRESGDTALSNRLGDGVTSDNTATEQLTALSGTSADGSGVTSVWGAKAYAEDLLADVVGDLDADESGSTDHITVNVVEEDGVITTVTVEEDNIADADDLAELSAKTVTALTSTNGSITASIDDAAGCKTYDIITDADKIKMSGFTVSGTSSFSGITNDDTIADAFDKANAVITENERVTAAALNDLNEKVSGLSENSLSGVSVNGHAVTVANHVAPIVIEGSTSAATPTSTEAIVVDTDANGNVTLGLGIIDCGTY